MRKITSGFTLVELMVSIAIVAILAAIAIPTYMEYTDKAYFSEVIQVAASYKTAVATCGLVLGTLDGCSQGQNGIPVPEGINQVSAINILNGTITATGSGNPPRDSTYIMAANMTDGGINWTISGTCKEAGLC